MLPIPTENKTWVADWENTVKLNFAKIRQEIVF